MRAIARKRRYAHHAYAAASTLINLTLNRREHSRFKDRSAESTFNE
jgi:hypothetical protein